MRERGKDFNWERAMLIYVVAHDLTGNPWWAALAVTVSAIQGAVG